MDTKEESSGLLKEAQEDFGRATRYFELKDWVTIIHYSQLAIEKSAKAVISCFEAFEWTHNPSEQLRRLVKKGLLDDGFLEVASYTSDAAPWHGRSTYGGLRGGVWKSPSELCTEEIATQILEKSRKSIHRVEEFIENFYGEKNGY